MDGKLKKTSEIRKVVIPMFEQMLEKLKKDVHVHLPDKITGQHNTNVEFATTEFKNTINKFSKEVRESFEEAINKIEFPEQKAPVVHVPKQDPPVVKVTEKKVKFPDIQEVQGTIEVKKIDKLIKLNEDLIQLITQQPKPLQKLPKVVPVEVKNWQHAVGGAQESGGGEKLWLREEYTYATVSGTRVPVQVQKWDDIVKVTEDYEYDVNADPVIKSRSVEPLTTVGA